MNTDKSGLRFKDKVWMSPRFRSDYNVCLSRNCGKGQFGIRRPDPPAGQRTVRLQGWLFRGTGAENGRLVGCGATL